MGDRACFSGTKRFERGAYCLAVQRVAILCQIATRGGPLPRSRKVNPYTPGAAQRPNVFVGRRRQFSVVDAVADQLEEGYPAEDYVFTGLRGMGKTVLLKEIGDRFRARGWMSGYYETRRSDDPGQAVANILADVLEAFDHVSWFKRLFRQAVQLGSLSLELEPHSGGPKAALVIRATDDERDLARDLKAVLTRIGRKAKEENTGLLLMIDELQQMKLADIETLLNVSKAIEDMPVAIIGAGLPTLPAIIARASSYAERFAFEPVDKLSEREAADAIVLPARKFMVSYDADVLARMLALSERYPYFLQLYASETWLAAGRPSDRPGTRIDMRALEAAIPNVTSRVDNGLYLSRWGRASLLEQQYMAAMAALGDGDISSGAVAKRMRRELSALATTRDRLMKKGLIHSPSTGRLDFSVPGFAEFVRRQVDVGEAAPAGARRSQTRR